MPKSKDYIPRSDADFDVWQENILTQFKNSKAKFGLSNESETELTNLQAEWETRNAAHIAAQSAAAAASVAKENARTAYEAGLRRQVRTTQNTPGVTDEDRAKLRITIRDTQPTAPGAPTTRPVTQVDTSQRLRHKLAVTDELTPTSRAKPKDTSYYEVWVKIGGPAPVDASELTYLDNSTTSSFAKEYPGEHGGKTAHYMLRWVNSRKEKGPWSQTVSATITA